MPFVAVGVIICSALTVSGGPLPPSIKTLRPTPTGGKFTGGFSLHDVNGDGHPDAIVSDWSNGDVGRLLILNGRGDGTFAPPQRYDAGALPYSVAEGDFNGDGIVDLACPEPQSTDLLLFFGSKDGDFRSVPYHVGVGTFDIVSADFDRNGTVDLAAAFDSSAGDGVLDGVLVLLGHGDGTFTANTIPVRGVEGVAAGDVNGDGAPDIEATVITRPATVAILIGNGRGTFHQTKTFPLGSGSGNGATAINPYLVATSDLNGDGHTDIITANSDTDNLSVLYGNGFGEFSAPTTADANRDAFGLREVAGLAVGDVNGDGRPDLLTGSGVFFNTIDTTGSFGVLYSFGSAEGGDVAIGDVDGDGRLDIVTTGTSEVGFGKPTLNVLLQRAPSPPTVVPAVVGKPLRAAKAALARVGSPTRPILTVHRRGRRGVVQQVTARGTRILHGAPVALVVNAGVSRHH